MGNVSTPGRKIKAMHMEYGKNESHRCGDCCNLSSYTQCKTWYKCMAYGDSRSEATDWEKRNVACGLFNVPFDGIPLIQKLKRNAKQMMDDPIDGQIAMAPPKKEIGG